MKKRTSIIIALLLLTCYSKGYCQDYPYSKEDTFFFNETIKFIAGEDVLLGSGTMPNGSFKYITFKQSSMAYDYKKYGDNCVGTKWSGHKFHIKRVVEYGNRKRGYTSYLVLGGGNIVNYECDIVNAIKTGEIVVNGFTPATDVKIVQQPISKADEIKKLKDLKDQGALTNDEFETEKKKILAK